MQKKISWDLKLSLQSGEFFLIFFLWIYLCTDILIQLLNSCNLSSIELKHEAFKGFTFVAGEYDELLLNICISCENICLDPSCPFLSLRYFSFSH